VRIDYVILGPSSGGVQFGGAAPDQMIGEVIVGGIAHEVPSSARPLHIGRCAGCSSVRVTYESIRNVISAIEREGTTPTLAALARQLKEAGQWRP
jgi:hypothetical protein